MVSEAPLYEVMTLPLGNGPSLGPSPCLTLLSLGPLRHGSKWAAPLVPWLDGVVQDPYQRDIILLQWIKRKNNDSRKEGKKTTREKQLFDKTVVETLKFFLLPLLSKNLFC